MIIGQLIHHERQIHPNSFAVGVGAGAAFAERSGVGGTAGGKGVCLRLPLRLPHQLAERGQGGQLAVGEIIFKLMKSIIAPLGITRKGASALRMRCLFIQIVFYIIVIYLFQKFISSFFCEVKIGTTMRPFRNDANWGNTHSPIFCF